MVQKNLGKGMGKGKRKGKAPLGETKPGNKPNPQPTKKAKPSRMQFAFSAKSQDIGKEIANCIWKIKRRRRAMRSLLQVSSL